jgi:ABC transporter
VTTSNLTPQAPTRNFVFYLGPFRFESEIEIPELRASTGAGDKLVSIRIGGVPTAIAGAIPTGTGCYVAADEYLLDIPGTARYYVRNGNEVRLEMLPDTPLENVTTYLLGSCFGALCHQNGLLPLHASAVEFAGSVTAFLGDSGAGKSTLAACLRERGHRIVSDDICLLQDQGNQIRVVPVASWLKLWNQSLQYLGQTPEKENRVYSTDDKFRLFLDDPLDQPASERPLLDRIVFLARAADSKAQPALQSVPLLDGIAGLMELTYAGYVPALAGHKSRVFQQCAHVMRQATAWRLTVPWGLDRMESVLDLLERKIFN